MGKRIRGTILQTPKPGELQILEDHVVTVDDSGLIASVAPVMPGDGKADVELPANTALLPGLIDTHLHAPQWPQLGTGLDLPLEEWLFQYTFPVEARCADESYARRVWDSMVPSLLAEGTTTVVYYGSTHEAATLALAETCLRYGQRAFVGRCAMDHPDGTPDFYRDESATQAIDASARSVQAINALAGPNGLVRPIVTPRFIPACTDTALAGLAEVAAAEGVLIQTHCSEGDWEHGYVLERHGCTDTESLQRFGLIQDHSVLGHATHLTESDRAILIAAGSGVAHCPLSNSYFSNAVFPARRNIEAGLRVGLGTDIAGGSTSSLLAQCGHAVTSSRMLDDGVDVDRLVDRGRPGARIDITTAFWMATLGGADLLGIPAGLLAPGRVFDAIAVDTGVDSTVAGWEDLDDWTRRFEKLVRRSRSGDITNVWVNGRDVGQ